ncbi:major facilitator superfamily domain-containing protein [Aspergillus welwitschiae]|uniref:Major facilitator superfamily domain-containing protein n=1 Tax=Aspergillus welwitschiae TaxID=1341132 RepID=A0A3F3PKU8_9EURO|nr:major facilitator superfamily domain-containing protein [Aspergillus welwitschiae]RDH27402.1 major facilitator superfamily domain-containing protein [Aspergillus welwitschiae]
MPGVSIENEVKHDNPSTISRDVVTESSGEESRSAAPPPIFNEQTNYVPLSTIITIFLACSTVDFVAVMDQTTLAGSLSIIGNTLNASNKTSWISGGYFVTSTCFQLLYGRLSDIWSRKYVLYIGLVIMFIGSLASSLAQTATQLIIFRAFTGMGGGGITSIAQMIVSDVVPLRERGKYQGILGAVIAIANGIGPVIGGALSPISHNSWRWIFRLMLPLTAISILAVMFFMPLRKVTGNWKAKLKAVDFFGVFLALGGTAVLMLGLTWGGGEYVWKSTHVIATLIVGAAVCVAFVLWEWKGHPYPLIPMHFFKSRIVNGACLTMFINGWNIIVMLYYIPTFYQLVFGYSTTKAGAMVLPITLLQTLSSTLSGLIVHWIGRYRESILVGWMIWAIGLGLMSTLNETSNLGKQIGYGLLTGIGSGNTLQPALIAVQAGVARRDMAVVTSFRNFIRNLGGTLGLAVSGTIINNLLSTSITSLRLTTAQKQSFLASPSNYLSKLPADEAAYVRALLIPAYKEGFRIVFTVNAALAALAFFLAVALMPQVKLERADDERLKEEGMRRREEQREGED